MEARQQIDKIIKDLEKLDHEICKGDDLLHTLKQRETNFKEDLDVALKAGYAIFQGTSDIRVQARILKQRIIEYTLMCSALDIFMEAEEVREETE